jgi:hypothetical protein
MALFYISIGLCLLGISGLLYAFMLYFSGQDSFGFGFFALFPMVIIALLLIVPASFVQTYLVFWRKIHQSYKAKAIWLLGLLLSLLVMGLLLI